MANEQSNQSKSQSEQKAPAEERSLQQSPERPMTRGRVARGGPLSLMRRMSEDMDRLFGEFFGFEPFSSSELGNVTRWPQIEVSHRGDKLIVRADLPGLEKDDVNVEVRDEELRISGERRGQSEQQQSGFYRSERTYGSFYRAIPLPPGAKTDTASATFEKGVLEVEIEVPEQSNQGRKIEVRTESH
ncbi:MAG TPA: Hsp20/alpha crystallin family protein [Polyangiaceae bacterium]|nr:Hsp20/alpha crystallin family protein [Polyangiaceae bacterium]